MSVFGGGCRVPRWSAWRPGAEETEPDIGFTGPRFRRRLSLISKMTIKVIHDVMPLGEDTKIYFVSFRGEVNQQFRINKMLIEDGGILPAAFSLSVWNAPPALASMALGIKAGYSAVYPGQNEFRSALLGASAALEAARYAARSGAARLLLVYADETLIPEYRSLEPEAPEALAFAALLEAGASAAAVDIAADADCETPGAFLAALEGRR